MIKMRNVTEESLDELQEYLELDYILTWATVEDWRELDTPVETLLIKWNAGQQRECNQNLDVLCESIDYEEEK